MYPLYMTYVVELWVLARFNNKWQCFISSVSSRKLKYGSSKALHKIKPIRKSLCLQDYYDWSYWSGQTIWSQAWDGVNLSRTLVDGSRYAHEPGAQVCKSWYLWSSPHKPTTFRKHWIYVTWVQSSIVKTRTSIACATSDVHNNRTRRTSAL